MEKNQPPQLNTNYFSKEKLPRHIHKEENQRFNIHWRSIPILNLLYFPEKGNMALLMDVAINSSILCISECVLDYYIYII